MTHNKSEQLGELCSAMAKAQAEIEVAGHTASNPHFRSKFADLTELVRASRPALTRNGLSVIHTVSIAPDDTHELSALLMHSSGQWLESRIRINPDKSDIQSLGKYITYLKRYSYAALVGVVSSDEDDDGESLVAPTRSNGYQSNPAQTKPIPVSDKIGKDQLDMMEHELRDHPELVGNILDKYKINSLKDVPRAEFLYIMGRCREIIKEKGNK